MAINRVLRYMAYRSLKLSQMIPDAAVDAVAVLVAAVDAAAVDAAAVEPYRRERTMCH
jgi:hypothetical protein